MILKWITNGKVLSSLSLSDDKGNKLVETFPEWY